MYDEDEDDFDGEVLAPWEDEDWQPERCSNCGKEFEDFSDMGCGYCDRRSPDWGVLP